MHPGPCGLCGEGAVQWHRCKKSTSRSCEMLSCVEGGDVRHGCGVFLDRSVVALTCWASSCHTHFSVNGEGSDKHEV